MICFHSSSVRNVKADEATVRPANSATDVHNLRLEYFDYHQVHYGGLYPTDGALEQANSQARTQNIYIRTKRRSQ